MAENKYLDELTQKMLSGVQEVFQSGRIREYFKAMSKLHTYSYRNSILILDVYKRQLKIPVSLTATEGTTRRNRQTLLNKSLNGKNQIFRPLLFLTNIFQTPV